MVAVDQVVDGNFPTALEVLTRFTAAELQERLADAADSGFRAVDDVRFTAPYRHPRKVWGIGLNYVEHAADLAESSPRDEPASFIKGDHTIVGPGEAISLPWQSERVTAEAELGLVIGRYCRDVTIDEALDYVWGVVPVLDQTAEDILARNPRFLTRAKNFPGFFSFGPHIMPMGDVLTTFGDIASVAVATVRNGDVHRKNNVANMMFSPQHLISFHSRVMPLFPGDVISTGTPGAVQIHPGDVAECQIDGIGTLRNPIIAGAPQPTCMS
ncbi:fumarylacetoacetate hydrolase family protein [Micromonospora sp. H33]|uniref:fumarylacetoacetate hydrolase family protein n=1 Tax=Micromonospora sp. H33 TaxID=3452215 RepID=UPI003F8B3BF5